MRAQIFTCLLALSAALLQLTVAEDLSEGIAVSAPQTITICEGNHGEIKCPFNTLISVHDTFYGRTSTQYCPNGPGVGHTSCSLGARALTVTRAKCQNRRSCTVDTHFFGDPCPGIYKYTRVTYSCRELSTAVSCDDEVFKIQCPAGKYIWLRDGFNGRVSNQYCDRGPRTDYACSLPYAMDHIASKCNNKEKCDFNRVALPDACPGTFKYTLAAYECRDFETHFVCDGPELLVIQCPGNKVIQIIRGFIGRNSEEYCSYGPRHTLECSSPTAQQAISNLCNNKRSCAVSSAIVPDPCVGTLKTTYVEYKCV